MKPLNIGIIIGPFPTLSETFIVNQITALIDEGHNVKLFSSRKRDATVVHNNIIEYNLFEKVMFKEKPSANKGKRLLRFFKLIFQHATTINWSLLFKSLNFFKYGKRALNLEVFFERKFFILNKRFDVVHVHFASRAIYIAAYKAEGFIKNAKLVVSFHGYDINPSKIEFYKSYYKTMFEQTDYFTVNTMYTKEILLQANPALTNVHILPESLDTDLFKRKKDKPRVDDTFNIVYCGRLVPFKGGVLLPLIMDELRQRGYTNISLKIIGDGELKDEIKKEIERLGLQNAIRLVGAITQEEIIEIFNNSDVFLLPGVYDKADGRAENQGLVIQEAQAMELPVVVSDVGGMKYGLIPNKTGFLVDENDINGFADQLEKLIKDPQAAKIMGAEGRKYVVENYQSKNLVRDLLDIYRT